MRWVLLPHLLSSFYSLTMLFSKSLGQLFISLFPEGIGQSSLPFFPAHLLFPLPSSPGTFLEILLPQRHRIPGFHMTSSYLPFPFPLLESKITKQNFTCTPEKSWPSSSNDNVMQYSSSQYSSKCKTVGKTVHSMSSIHTAYLSGKKKRYYVGLSDDNFSVMMRREYNFDNIYPLSIFYLFIHLLIYNMMGKQQRKNGIFDLLSF